MGYLFSVTKSSTTFGLNASELALLIFGVILVIGLIGEYKVPERDKRLMKVFEMLVIIGVAGELLADGGNIPFFQPTTSNIGQRRIREANDKALDAKSSGMGAETSAGIAEERALSVCKQADALDSRFDNAARQLAGLQEKIFALTPRQYLLRNAAPRLVRQLKPFAKQTFGYSSVENSGRNPKRQQQHGPPLQTSLILITRALWKIGPPNLLYTDTCGGPFGRGNTSPDK